MSQAAAYALNQWAELTVFLKDAAVPIDNKASELEMKRIVLNRKNSLLVGNVRGGETSAILASLTSTCRRQEIDPQRYLTQLFAGLSYTPVSELCRWLPDEWKRRDTPPPVPPPRAKGWGLWIAHSLIAASTTTTALGVRCEFHTRKVKITDAQIDTIQVTPDSIHAGHNYTIRPNSK